MPADPNRIKGLFLAAAQRPTADRPGFREMAEDCAGGGGFDAVLVLTLDRFSRLDPADFFAAAKPFIDAGVQLVTTDEGPKDWNTAAISELRKKLAAASERFTVENLRRAHEIHYRKALVDIISMVKHAAEEEQPLLTAEERVDRALARLSVAHVARDDHQHQRADLVGGNERQRRRVQDEADCAELIRRRLSRLGRPRT